MKNLNLCAFADEAAASLDGQIAALKDNGIDLLEIRFIDGKNISELSVPEVKIIKDKLDSAGIAVWSIGSPAGKVDIKDDSHIDTFCHLIELAAVLKASHMRIFSFYGTNGSASYEDAVLERLERFIEKAKGSGVTLCHENEKDIYGDIAARCLAIHQKLPAIKAVFDPANFIQCGEDPAAAWELLAPYVEYLHIKDAKPDGTVVPAGHGGGGIPAILSDFTNRGGGTLTIEPHLQIFDGLDSLEAGKAENTYTYPDQRTAFDAAVNALKKIIESL
ncbi:MAG: sugar phosphate isomerase/epimerase [Oscillospiraceae bacterium]|nr:sugar phosphate isomerase/epimerase [Oscillospiraceae bacterium]